MNRHAILARLLLPSRGNLFLTSVGTLTAIALGTELLLQQLGAFTVLLAQGQQWQVPAASLCGAALGLAAAIRLVRRGLLLSLMSVWSLALSLGALGLFYGVPTGYFSFLFTVHTVLQAACLAALLVMCLRELVRPALQLGLLPALLRPQHLLAIALVLSALVMGFAQAGVAASPFLLALLAAGVAILGESALTYAGSARPRSQGKTVVLSSAIALSGMTLVSQSVSQAERLSYPGQVLFATGDQNSQRVILSSDAAGLEVFVDKRVHVAALDQLRYVLPLSSVPAGARRVLVFEAGSGLATAQVLRHPNVQEVVVVSPSDNLARLQQRVPRLRELGENWLNDPRVSFEVGEPLFWLARSAEMFDFIAADFPPPLDYESSKFYTRYAFGLLTEHLLPGGTAVVSGIGKSRFPETYLELEALAGRERLEQASIPSLGEWAFVRLRSGHSLGTGESTLDSPEVAYRFQAERDAEPRGRN